MARAQGELRRVLIESTLGETPTAAPGDMPAWLVGDAANEPSGQEQPAIEPIRQAPNARRTDTTISQEPRITKLHESSSRMKTTGSSSQVSHKPAVYRRVSFHGDLVEVRCRWSEAITYLTLAVKSRAQLDDRGQPYFHERPASSRGTH